MELWQALVLGGLQGVAELFPISSLAQTILLPALLRWNINQAGDDYLAFVVALHLATAVALVLYFWKDWAKVVGGFVSSVANSSITYSRQSKFAWLLVAGTVIVGAVGLVAEKRLRVLFEDASKAWLVGVILVVNGFVLLLGDLMKRRASRAHPTEEPEHVPEGSGTERAMHAAFTGGVVSTAATAPPDHPVKASEDLTFPQATLVGAAQTLALLPGISRSGVTIIGGLLAGLTYEEATRFAFMLATPVIFAAGARKLPDLLHQGHDTVMLAVYGSIVAFVTAFLSIAFLMRYFHNNRLSPFGYFCILFGGASAAYLKMHG